MAVLSRLARRRNLASAERTERTRRIPRVVRILFIAFLVMRLISTARQLRREIAKIREEGLVPQPA